MYVGLKQPRGDGERYVTPARAAAKETNTAYNVINQRVNALNNSIAKKALQPNYNCKMLMMDVEA